MINGIRELVETKLKVIDIRNRQDKEYKPQRIIHELYGIKQALLVMGIHLELDINPYYYEDGKPSTYRLNIYN